jgi:hypothetical protein
MPPAGLAPRHAERRAAAPAAPRVVLLSAPTEARRMATHPIRFGLQTGQQDLEWGPMLDLWQKADAWGYDLVVELRSLLHHLPAPELPCLESWTTLAALAQVTRRAASAPWCPATRTGPRASPQRWRRRSITSAAGGSISGSAPAGFEPEHRSFGINFKTVRGKKEHKSTQRGFTASSAGVGGSPLWLTKGGRATPPPGCAC